MRAKAQEEHLKREMMIKAGIDPDNPEVSDDEGSEEEVEEGLLNLVDPSSPKWALLH